ncbi:MAG: serine hydrolase domain-containing protein [Verrucomicrobiota bacterium]|nr:serine hydrolase domain-containing protein [Verrucomicrobiota bacterium]
MDQIKQLFEKSNVPAAKLWGANFKSGEEWKLSFNYSENDDDIFRIASMTKLLTTIGSLHLVEKGKLVMDQPLNDFLPGLADVFVIDDKSELRSPKSQVTLTHLLTHTSGFAYPFTSEKLDSYLDRPRGPANPREFLTWPKVFDSGENFCYGVGIDWVGKLIENISGKSLEDYFRENITEPLGMDSTWFNPPSEIHANIVDYHVRAGDGFEIAGPRIPEPTDFYGGGGGLMSSAKDYVQLLKCLYFGGQLEEVRILKEDTVDTMFQDHLPKEIYIGMTEAPEEHSWSNNGEFCEGMAGDRWGLGWALDSEDEQGCRSPGTAYWAGIFNSYFTLDRKKGIAVLYFSQFLPFDDNEAYKIYRTFESEVYKESIDD